MLPQNFISRKTEFKYKGNKQTAISVQELEE